MERESFVDFISRYLNEVSQIALALDKKKIDEMIDELVKVKKSHGRLFIIGVGGSAGNAGHAVNDFRKLVELEAYSPTDNVSEITARTNDEGWETVFEGFLKISNLSNNDCLLIFSVGGGNSEKNISLNICKAISYAKNKKTKILAIVGREDGYAFKYADTCLLIPTVNENHVTPHSEAFQAIIWHLLVSHPNLNSNKTKW